MKKSIHISLFACSSSLAASERLPGTLISRFMDTVFVCNLCRRALLLFITFLQFLRLRSLPYNHHCHSHDHCTLTATATSTTFLPPPLYYYHTPQPSTTLIHFNHPQPTTMYHKRSISAPSWGNLPTTPAVHPVLASPQPPRTTAPRPSRRLLTPRPPLPSSFPGYHDVPATAESSSFALLERRKSKDAALSRSLPAPGEFWKAAGTGGNLAARRGQKVLGLQMGEKVKEEYKDSCCGPRST
jgi:hypothetical protein